MENALGMLCKFTQQNTALVMSLMNKLVVELNVNTELFPRGKCEKWTLAILCQLGWIKRKLMSLSLDHYYNLFECNISQLHLQLIKAHKEVKATANVEFQLVLLSSPKSPVLFWWHGCYIGMVGYDNRFRMHRQVPQNPVTVIL